MENWKETDGASERTFLFESFSDAITWMFACSLELEPIGRYPEWTNIDTKVVVKVRAHGAQDATMTRDTELIELFDEHYTLFTSKGAQQHNDGE